MDLESRLRKGFTQVYKGDAIMSKPVPDFNKFKSKFYCGSGDVVELAKFADVSYRQFCMAVRFINHIHQNYDCDSDAHKHGTPCRKCDANELLVWGFRSAEQSVDDEWNNELNI